MLDIPSQLDSLLSFRIFDLQPFHERMLRASMLVKLAEGKPLDALQIAATAERLLLEVGTNHREAGELLLLVAKAHVSQGQAPAAPAPPAARGLFFLFYAFLNLSSILSPFRAHLFYPFFLFSVLLFVQRHIPQHKETLSCPGVKGLRCTMLYCI